MVWRSSSLESPWYGQGCHSWSWFSKDPRSKGRRQPLMLWTPSLHVKVSVLFNTLQPLMSGPHLIFLVWMRSFGNLMLKTLGLGPSYSFDISGKAILGCQYGFQTPNMCSKNAMQWCWNTRICGFVWKCGTQKCQYVVGGNNLTLDGQEPRSSHIQIDLNYFQLLKPIMSFWWK